MRITQEAISYINLFESVSKAKIKDCFEEEKGLLFVVEEGYIKKALGQDNRNIRRIEQMTKKKIFILGFSSNPVKFINNLLYPIKVKNIEIDDKIAKIYCLDTRSKGKVFGRERENLKRIKLIVKKYFKEIEDIQVI